MKVLTDSNYIIGRVNSHQTHCVHRMRLHRLKSDYHFEDVEVTIKQLYPDTERIEDYTHLIPVLPTEIRIGMKETMRKHKLNSTINLMSDQSVETIYNAAGFSTEH